MPRPLLALAVLLAACSSIGAGRVARELVPLEMREMTAGERTMNVTTDLTDAVVDTILHDFAARLQADVYGIWTIPGKPDQHLVFAEPPAVEGQPYGPRIYVIRNRFGQIDVLHAGQRLMDADFVDPAFFGDERSVLLLAEYGSEDSWGLAAIHIGDGVRDLGTIPVMRPEGAAGFTESAVPAARVSLEQGKYVVTFDGEILDADAAERDKWFSKGGQRAVFVEEGNAFRFARTE